jgi:hypothetical protein
MPNVEKKKIEIQGHIDVSSSNFKVMPTKARMDVDLTNIITTTYTESKEKKRRKTIPVAHE